MDTTDNSNESPPLASDALLRAVLQTAVDAIISIDPRGMILHANEACTPMFGYPQSELLGQNIKKLMPARFADQHDGYLENYLETGIRQIIGIGREVVGKKRDGTEFPIHLAVSEIEVDGQQVFTGIIRDISELKAAEAKLAEMNQNLEQIVEQQTQELREVHAELVQNEKFSTLGKVAGGIAHEIRNPLNAVKTSAYYLLHAREPSVAKVTEHLSRIDRQVTIIDNVVTALTDVARLPDADLRPIEIIRVLKSAVGSVGLAGNIDTQWQLESPTTSVFADETQVVIAFTNLVRNARDAMPDGGVLQITTRREGNLLRISFADTGQGVPLELHKVIFEPLYTTKAKGMGLGLSITKAIVEKNKGDLDFTSDVGVGSTFSIRLNAEPQDQTAHDSTA